ncbi:MAG: hypothetical protein AB1758_36730, partial [Candidatus Eremiobacterota bacterium]
MDWREAVRGLPREPDLVRFGQEFLAAVEARDGLGAARALLDYEGAARSLLESDDLELAALDRLEPFPRFSRLVGGVVRSAWYAWRLWCLDRRNAARVWLDLGDRLAARGWSADAPWEAWVASRLLEMDPPRLVRWAERLSSGDTGASGSDSDRPALLYDLGAWWPEDPQVTEWDVQELMRQGRFAEVLDLVQRGRVAGRVDLPSELLRLEDGRAGRVLDGWCLPPWMPPPVDHRAWAEVLLTAAKTRSQRDLLERAEQAARREGRTARQERLEVLLGAERWDEAVRLAAEPVD